MIKQLTFAVGFAASILALAAGLRYAQNAGMLEAESSRRIMQAIIGLALAAYANFMPKQIGPERGSLRAQSWSQATLRVGGWSFTLAGLAYAGLWAFAPLDVADIASMTVIIAAMVATIGYAARSYAACRAARPS